MISSARRRLGRLFRALSQRLNGGGERRSLGRPSTPTLSVVIPTYNVAEYLTACLESVLHQSMADLEVIVVDDGSTDETAEIARSFHQRDGRVIVLTQPNAGQGAARNRGVALASGTYLMFVDGDDVVPPGAFERMTTLLDKTQSSFALGPVLRLRPSGSLAPPVWNRSVYGAERRAITIDEFPAAMLDVLACNRMFRRTFWVESVGGFRGGIAYEDHAPMVKAYLVARQFDVVIEPIYHWRMRADGSSTRQQKHLVSNLVDRIEVKAETLALIDRHASSAVRSAWVGRVLDLDLAAYIAPALAAGADYRAMLQRAVARHLDLADSEALGYVRVQQKISAALVARERWGELADFLALLRAGGGQLPTTVRDGEVVIADGVAGLAALPDPMFQLGRVETELDVCLRDVGWRGDVLGLTGWAVINMVTAEAPTVRAWLVEIGGAGRLDVVVHGRPDDEATVWSRQRHADASRYGFELEIDPRTLPVTGGRRARWQLRLEVEDRGLRREADVRHAFSDSVASLRRLPAQVIDGRRVTPTRDAAHGFHLVIRPAATVDQLPVLRPDGAFSGTVSAAGSWREVAFLGRGDTAPAHGGRLERMLVGGQRFSVPPPPSSAEPATLSLLDEAGRRLALSWPSATAREPIAVPGTALIWVPSSTGDLALAQATSILRLIGVDVAADRLSLYVAAEGEEMAWLRGANIAIPGVGVSAGPGQRRWDFILRRPDGRPAPLGTYALVIGSNPGDARRVPVAEPSYAALGASHLTRWHRVVVGTTPGGQARVVLRSPLRDDERGEFAQQRLREEFGRVAESVQRQVMFCGTERVLRLALAAATTALLGLDPPFAVAWEVSDSSREAPAGARPIVARSREWYEALGTSAVVCSTVDLNWFPISAGRQLRIRALQPGGPVPSDLTRWSAVLVGDAGVAAALRAEASGLTVAEWTATGAARPRDIGRLVAELASTFHD